MRESWLFFKTFFTGSKLIHSFMAKDGGSIREANVCSQWFISFQSTVPSGLEKPLLAGYIITVRDVLSGWETNLCRHSRFSRQWKVWKDCRMHVVDHKKQIDLKKVHIIYLSSTNSDYHQLNIATSIIHVVFIVRFDNTWSGTLMIYT